MPFALKVRYRAANLKTPSPSSMALFPFQGTSTPADLKPPSPLKRPLCPFQGTLTLADSRESLSAFFALALANGPQVRYNLLL
jgi:hypothetical protein